MPQEKRDPLEYGLAVQSYCFRAFRDNRKTAALVKECGLVSIEVCVVHADFAKPESFAEVVRTYREQGVEVVSIGVNAITGDERQNRTLFECARLAGLAVMSIDFDINSVPESFAQADRLAEEYGINLGIHNHGGRHWLGSSQALRWVFSKTSRRVGLSLDTAWALHSKEDPVAMAREFGDRLHVIHVKDFVFDRAGKPEDVIVGTGNLDLQAFDRVLAQAGFRGAAVLEYEGDESNPVPALRECVGEIRKHMPAIGGNA